MSISNINLRNMDTIQRAIVIKNKVDSFELAMARSLMITVLEERMKHGVANLLYYRSNGDVIEAYGTTHTLIIENKPNNEKPNTHQKNVTLFYDMELQRWHGFRWERFVGILKS